jgi:LmbE family N-acetylglucosaminyl deacetylase
MELLWPEEGPAHKVHAVYALSEKADVWIDIADTLELKIEALKCHASQMGDWDPAPMIREWAASDAKTGRKKLKAVRRGKRGKKPKGKLKYAEAFRVMILKVEDKPPES